MAGLENIRHCLRCKKIFTDFLGKKMCPECRLELDDTLKEIKAYIREHRNVKITEISEKFEIPHSQILDWIHAEELELTPDSGIKISCKTCGAQILSGIYCNECKNKMIKSFNTYTTVASPSSGRNGLNRDGNKMRYLSQNKDKK